LTRTLGELRMQTIDVRVLQEMGIGWSSSCLKSFVQRCLARQL